MEECVRLTKESSKDINKQMDERLAAIKADAEEMNHE